MAEYPGSRSITITDLTERVLGIRQTETVR